MLDWIRKPYEDEKQLSALSAQCCLNITSQEFSLAYTRYTANKLMLEFYASYPYDSQAGLKERLLPIAKQYQLKKIPCSWILSPKDYQLIQTDLLPVTADEFQEAVRWKIKDLLRFSVDDVVIDQFAIPSSKFSTKNKIMVVAAQASYLQKISEDIQTSGLSLSTIDIPELALRNIVALSAENNQTHILIYMQEATTHFIITCGKQLYFSRSLDFGWKNNKKPDEEMQHIHQLVSEIQRSFDYYQNQWHQSGPAHISLAATQFVSDDMLQQLSHLLSLPVKKFHLEDRFLSKQEMKLDQQAKYLPMIGELFRQEYERYAAAN